MARKGLPAKYAKMGFGPGWKAYKRARSGAKMAGPKKKHHAASPAHHATKKHGTNVIVLSGPSKHKGGSKMSTATKNKIEDLKAKASRALAKVRNMHGTKAGEAVLAVGEGLAGGIASSYVFGMIPTPKMFPKPGAFKSAAQMGVSIAIAIKAKNKHVKYIAMGGAFMGAIGLVRDLFPVPTMAGEVDASMYGEFSMISDSDGLGDPLGGDQENDGMGDPLGVPAQFEQREY